MELNLTLCYNLNLSRELKIIKNGDLYILDENVDVRELNPLTLAFLGDAIYEAMVRQLTLNSGKKPAHKLHMEAVKYVKASSQAKAIEKVMHKLTEQEVSVFKRGRNANSASVPKNADLKDYKKATGLEALFGYLYIKKKFERIEELFFMLVDNVD